MWKARAKSKQTKNLVVTENSKIDDNGRWVVIFEKSGSIRPTSSEGANILNIFPKLVSLLLVFVNLLSFLSC